MPGLKGIQRGNFPDSRIRRNWNKIATWFHNMLGEGFALAADGKLILSRFGLTQKWNGYDKTGSFAVQTIPQTVPYDTERLNTDALVFTDFSNGELTVDGNGSSFLLTATVTMQQPLAGNVIWLCRAWLEVDTGSGWSEIPGSSVNLGSRG